MQFEYNMRIFKYYFTFTFYITIEVDKNNYKNTQNSQAFFSAFRGTHLKKTLR
jgi:hypothetical protein